ncbi:MAG: Ig-like domain-containing protein, partial [Micrococcales bacterium]|nr:Ig-like domain-containing protein [Micrococcales bacterium]
MPNRLVVYLLSALVAFALLAGSSPTAMASPASPPAPEKTAPVVLQPPDLSPYDAPHRVQPDFSYQTPQGTRIEVYASAGSNGADADWRAVSEFTYLVSSVPKNGHIAATLYNMLWDKLKITTDAKTGKLGVATAGGKTPSKVFAPTQAFLAQLNRYATKKDRQAHIQVLASKSTADAALKAGSSLAGLLKKSGVMKICAKQLGACISDVSGAFNHSKYALFSKAKDSTGKMWSNVVWLTSANMNSGSGGAKSSLSIAVFGDKAAYDGLTRGVWQAAWTGKAGAAYRKAAAQGIQGVTKGITYYPSPRTRDFDAEFLESMTNKALGTKKSGCSVYLVHSRFTSARTRVADGLAALADDGCTVRIVLDVNNLRDLTGKYFAMSKKLRKLVSNVEVGEVHDKTLTMTYTAKGKQYATAWVGSENLTSTGLGSDELQAKITIPGVALAVEAQSARLYKLAAAGKKVVPVADVTTSAAAVSMTRGTKLKLTASVVPKKATIASVIWTSDQPSVATVDATGLVKAVKAGSAVITATTLSGGKVSTTSVFVTASKAGKNVPQSPALTLAMPSVTAPGAQTTATVTWA